MTLIYRPWYRPAFYDDWKDNDEEAVESSVPQVPPTNITPPVINSQTGDLNHGSTLEATPGVWSGDDSVSGNWAVNGVPVSGETGLTWVIPNTIVSGDTLSYIETAINIYGETQASSNSFQAEPPNNTSLPSISTPALPWVVGTTFSANPGGWSPDGTTFYGWFRNMVGIIGASGSTHNLVASDHDKTITVQVQKSNSYGVDSAMSAGIYVYFDPSNTVPPVINYTSTMPPTVTTPPTWQFANSVSNQWRRNGVDVSGQTSTIYTGTLEIGDSLVYRTTATNDNGSISVDSNTIVITGLFDPFDQAAMLYLVTGTFGDSTFENPEDEVAMIYSISGSVA